MDRKVLHQFAEGMYQGDAVSDHVFLLQRWLHEMGYLSNIYTTKYEPALNELVLPVQDYRPLREEKSLVYHHAVGSGIAETIAKFSLPQILIYHNITPPKYYADSDPILSAQLQKGRRQLEMMRDRTLLALADSRYNELELVDLGYEKTAVLPIVLEESKYDGPINEDLAAQLAAARPVLLFVGRLAPNKRQQDLITLLYYYRRLEPDARLILVGSLQNRDYVRWLSELAQSLGLKDAVSFTGHVNQQDLVTYYKSADLYVSMSEHEGFGKPLIESMYLGLPVLAYSSSAVPSTLGDAGVLFHEKKFESLAELIDALLQDTRLQERLRNQQKRRVQQFLEPHVRQLWEAFISI